MARSHEFGRSAEDLAAALLERKDWRILDRNWRFHHKEIDLVAERAGVVAFVEVKARKRGWGHPLDSITWTKRRDLWTAARGWIAENGRSGWSYRFDAVVVTREGRTMKVEHVEDAWRG